MYLLFTKWPRYIFESFSSPFQNEVRCVAIYTKGEMTGEIFDFL